jgi:poly-gamma-glutamate capsule biosynthesis protein CapA/YwtB (metallophosphatase superfamily)
MTKRMRLTATGDALITRRMPLYDDPEFMGMVELIRGCDVAFTNTEVTLSRFRGWPVVESGGMALSVDPRCADDLRRLGFNCTAFANNHTLIFGEEGVLHTLDALRNADLVCAGAGANLGEARLPAYLDTINGRLGLIGCASSFAKGQRAGDQTAILPGRPGLNPLRFKSTIMVDARAMDEIKRIARETGIEAARQFGDWMNFYPPSAKEGEGEYSFLHQAYAVTDSEMRVRTEPHEGDLKEIARWTAEAKRQAGFAMVSIHAHEEGRERWLPADFLPAFAHAVIDAGADIVVGHGPHLLRGLEFYKGKPIFYSLGNFIFQYETLERFAADDYDTMKRDPAWTAGQVTADIHQNLERSFPADDRYWETVLPLCEFEGDRLCEITLYPLTLGFKQPVWERGIPRLASGAQAEATLRRFADLSAPFGTHIENADGIGHVRIPNEQ